MVHFQAHMATQLIGGKKQQQQQKTKVIFLSAAQLSGEHIH